MSTEGQEQRRDEHMIFIALKEEVRYVRAFYQCEPFASSVAYTFVPPIHLSLNRYSTVSSILLLYMVVLGSYKQRNIRSLQNPNYKKT